MKYQSEFFEPFVSVIVPVFNMEETLTTAVSGLFRVKTENIEIIIVNDGSEDGSDKVIEELSKESAVFPQISLISVHSTQNKGRAAALNLGLEKASGKLQKIRFN